MILQIPDDPKPWPSLGGGVCDWIEANLCFGPGDLRGEPAKLDDEKRALIWRMYEVFPRKHAMAGRRRFKRAGISLAKGTAKTELAAWIAAAELSADAPVRCIGWKGNQPQGGPVTDPYVVLVAYTEEQSDELCYGALKTIIEESPIADEFDIGLERIMRKGGDGKAVSLSNSPNSRDGARTTFQVCDEPLALDTHVPTLSGWTTMGTIRKGEVVFGRNGKPCKVLAVGPVHSGRPCCRLIFGDGSSIVSDSGHEWPVYDRHLQKERVLKTADLARCKWKRFKIARPSVLELPDSELPIDPYILGLWLGDGDSRNATISVGHRDLAETEAAIQAVGYIATKCKTDRTPLLYLTFPNSRFSGFAATKGNPDNYSMVGELRKLGLLKNKHIPASYLRAGTTQRLSLLQGLMDSDGYISESGACTFVNGNARLMDDTSELLRTLGYRPRQKSTTVDARWKKPSTIHRIHFTANRQQPPFRMTRKRSRIRIGGIDRSLTIHKVEPVESVPVRCIEVNSEDHLFLAGESMLPTHNTHWWTLPRLKQAHQTMLANIPKRKLADAWTLEITTAPEPGSGSIAEHTMEYAQQVKDGRIKDERLLYFHRQASDEHDLTTEEGARAAVIEASGPAAAWRDIESIVQLWRDPTTDRSYWERVYGNRLVKSSYKAFDVQRWKTLAKRSSVKDGDLIVLGFDGAMFQDSTGIVATHIQTGFQWVPGVWERPYGPQEWQVPAEEVDETIRLIFKTYNVWRLYADPPYWQSWISKWAGQFGAERVVEWWTNRRKPMSYALESYQTAMKEGTISHDGNEALTRHVGNAYKADTKMRDEAGKALWLIQKERQDSPHKIDLAMASVLSWEARNDAIAAGAVKPKPQYAITIL